MSLGNTMVISKLSDSISAGRTISLHGLPPPRASSLRHEPKCTEVIISELIISVGQYILGQTLGEGEFGKVKLGWLQTQDNNKRITQVAIKLIRKESLSTSKSRLNKIEREINVLQRIEHPNIVKCHEVVETDKYIGIILEYASGGELFDFILAHRYLKDQTASRLFAQLVSAVSYLHAHGIVHRDLKLENLLLDHNHNIIVTDFGFANTFELAPSLMDNSRGNVRIPSIAKEDLMHTSCGSPCYAAPELVVSDGAYCGRKVDVWSCGVILYAMLSGYLPFDDDPDNPEGDNISLLYKYIMSTSLTFPEYVTALARDLLRHMLVPDPRHRITLDSVSRHSWVDMTQNRLANQVSPTKNSRLNPPDMLRSASEHRSCQRTVLDTTPTSYSLHTEVNACQTHRASVMGPLSTGTQSSVRLHSQKGESDSMTINEIESLEVSRKVPSHRVSLYARSDVQARNDVARSGVSSLSEKPKPIARLPAPQRKPRPTSYHPSSSIPRALLDFSRVSALDQQRETRNIITSDEHLVLCGSSPLPLQQAQQSALKNSRTASPRSTTQNAAGEIYGPDAVLLLQQEQRGVISPTASGPHRNAHRKAASSISSMTAIFNKLRASTQPSKLDIPQLAEVKIDAARDTQEQTRSVHAEISAIAPAESELVSATPMDVPRLPEQKTRSNAKFRTSLYLPRSLTTGRLSSMNRKEDTNSRDSMSQQSESGIVYAARRLLNLFSVKRRDSKRLSQPDV